MNLQAVRAIYMFEMARAGRTLMKSITVPSNPRCAGKDFVAIFRTPDLTAPMLATVRYFVRAIKA
jgi:hypothetical protein